MGLLVSTTSRTRKQNCKLRRGYQEDIYIWFRTLQLDYLQTITHLRQIESFWSLWTHLNPPSLLVPTTDLILFHSGIKRPVWEDSLNVDGGKWIIRLKKGIADRIWEDIVMAVVGDQFDDCASTREDGVDGDSGGNSKSSSTSPEICGCTLSVRQSEDILSVWNKDGSDGRVRQNIR